MRGVNPSSAGETVNSVAPSLGGRGRRAGVGLENGRGVGRGGASTGGGDHAGGCEGGGGWGAQTRTRIPASMRRAGITPAEPGQGSGCPPAPTDEREMKSE
jgi:hypothetical protein